jgi:hypothetical protein
VFNQQTFYIHRLTATTGNQEDYQDKGDLITGSLDPIDTELGAVAEGAFARSYRLLSKDTFTSLKDSDRLINDEGEIFEVKGVQKFNHPPRHIEAVLEKTIDQD